MSRKPEHIVRLRELTRIRAARARLALGEASRLRHEHMNAEAALAHVLSAGEHVSGRAGRIGMWACARQANVNRERARVAADAAWERYRVATLRLDTIVAQWKKELAAAQRRKLDRGEETLAEERASHAAAVAIAQELAD